MSNEILCIQGLSDDIPFCCNNKPIKGIENNVLIINKNDIDYATSILNLDQTIITRLALKTGKRGYRVEGIKNIFGGSSKPVIEDTSVNGHTHSINIRLFKTDAASFKQINSMVDGGQFVAIVETKWKGEAGAAAFEVLGYDVGLEISADSEGRVYAENDGAYLITLATPKGYKEPKVGYKWLETNYQTTKTLFDAKLVEEED